MTKRHLTNIVSTAQEQTLYRQKLLSDIHRRRWWRKLAYDVMACIGFVALIFAALWIWSGAV